MPDFVIDISVLFVVKVGTYITVCSAAILVYDYFLTLPDEVQYVWRTHWCLGKVLYLSSKYLILVVFLVELHWITSRNISEAECRIFNTILHYSYLLAVIAAENIMTLRVWALWHQRLWVTIMLGCLCVVGIVLGFKDISTGYRNDVYLTAYAKASLSYPGCATTGDDRTASATSYITVLAHETGHSCVRIDGRRRCSRLFVDAHLVDDVYFLRGWTYILRCPASHIYRQHDRQPDSADGVYQLVPPDASCSSFRAFEPVVP